MATFQEFFSAGQDPPVGWTERWATADSSWATQADPTAVNGTVLTHASTADGQRLLSWDQLDGTSAVELMLRVRFDTKDGVSANNGLRLVFAASGAAAAETGIMMTFNNTLESYAFYRYTAGAPTGPLGSELFSPVLGNWYRIRVRHEPGASPTFRAKMWADGAAEPGSWTVNHTAAQWNLTSGWFGIGNRDKDNTFSIDWITAADAGGTAPNAVYTPEAGTEHLALSGHTPVSFPVAPSKESLRLTGYAPSVSPVTIAAEHLTLSGFAPNVYLGLLSYPPGKRLYLRGYPPVVTAGRTMQLVVVVPPLETLFDASGPRAELTLRLPPLASLLTTGSGLSLNTAVPETLLTGLTGSTGGLQLSLPALQVQSGGGSRLVSVAPALETLLTGTVGATSGLVLSLPPFAALFAGQGETLGRLVVNLPGLLGAFAGYPQTQGTLVAAFPALETVFTGKTGTVAALQLDLPALTALFSSYEELTGELVITLPAFRVFMGGAIPDRFDGELILEYRRPT